MARKYNLEAILAAESHLAIQGEICGPGIQGNKLGLKEKELFVFDVQDVSAGRYFDLCDLVDFCVLNKLTTVPAAALGNAFDLTPDEMLQMAEGKYINTSNEREGLVFRPQVEVIDPSLPTDNKRLSMKVISNGFLLKEKD